MNRTKSKEIYSIQRFVHPSLEPIAVGSTFQRSRSFMERDFLTASSSNDGVLEARSRFEEVFLSSPRAQVSSIIQSNVHNAASIGPHLMDSRCVEGRL